MSNDSLDLMCPECDRGVCYEVNEPYDVLLPDGDRFMIPSLTVLRCNACGEIAIPAASARWLSFRKCWNGFSCESGVQESTIRQRH